MNRATLLRLAEQFEPVRPAGRVPAGSLSELQWWRAMAAGWAPNYQMSRREGVNVEASDSDRLAWLIDRLDAQGLDASVIDGGKAFAATRGQGGREAVSRDVGDSATESIGQCVVEILARANLRNARASLSRLAPFFEEPPRMASPRSARGWWHLMAGKRVPGPGPEVPATELIAMLIAAIRARGGRAILDFSESTVIAGVSRYGSGGVGTRVTDTVIEPQMDAAAAALARATAMVFLDP